jgi:hypothetical protein
MEGRRRDLAMFNLAIDSKLNGCDFVRLRIDDVLADGGVRNRATMIQKKTGRPVQFEITEQTRIWASGSPPSTLARADICSQAVSGKAALVDAAIRPHRPLMGGPPGSIARHTAHTFCAERSRHRITSLPTHLLPSSQDGIKWLECLSLARLRRAAVAIAFSVLL